MTPSGSIEIAVCVGEALRPFIPALASLRVRVFRAWPYLYDGDQNYEEHYLQSYARSPNAAVILARDGDTVIGASTCLPMTDETPNVQEPFVQRGWDPADFFYFGESVLLPDYRGRGLGVTFFEKREEHAKSVSNCAYAGFCSVVRGDDHPARPPGFTKLDEFWTHRGFTRRPDLVCRMSWKDVGEPGETAKDLVFWLKSLRGRPLP